MQKKRHEVSTDPELLLHLEKEAEKAASALERMISDLQQQLAQLAGTNHQHLNAYTLSIEKLCSSVEIAIGSGTTLMDDCERLCDSLQCAEVLAHQLYVKQITVCESYFESSRELRHTVERLDSIL